MKASSLAAALSLFLLASPGWTALCLDNRDFHQNLPTTIGREDQNTPFRFVLKCDTVFVRKGVTTVVHSGAMLYFAKPTLSSVIKVEGTLRLKGSKNAYVYLTGSVDTKENGTVEPGNRQWGGIEVAETGTLEMEYTGVVRAPTPITTFSPRVRIVNSFFKGSSGIILPDGNLMPLETAWHAVAELDLGKRKSGEPGASAGASESGLSQEEKAELLSKRQAPFWTWKKTAAGVALGVAGVGLVFLMQDEPAQPVDALADPLGQPPGLSLPNGKPPPE